MNESRHIVENGQLRLLDEAEKSPPRAISAGIKKFLSKVCQFDLSDFTSEPAVFKSRKRYESKAQLQLQQSARELITARRESKPLPDIDAFQRSLSQFLVSSHTRPTMINETIEITELLEDPELKAGYLERMIGGTWATDEQTWRTQRPGDYWSPVTTELEWLLARQAELSEYPIASVIEFVVGAEASRVLEASLEEARLQEEMQGRQLCIQGLVKPMFAELE